MLAVGPMSSETRAASECAVSLSIFGISVDLCADPDPETSRARQAEREGENATLAVGVVEADSSGTCNIEAHNTQGEVEPGGQDVNVTMAICTLP
jgi:hypothetical protein